MPGFEDQTKWDRREEDKKARTDITKAIEKLEKRIDDRLESLGERVNELDEFLRGGTNNEDPLGTRVHLVETGLTELRILVKGDSLGRGSLIELTKQAISDSAEAKKVAHGKVEVQVTKRGQNVSVVLAIISTIGVLLVSFKDQLREAFHPVTPAQHLERIKKEIEENKKDRGPEVEAKLKEIEATARRMRRGY